MPMAWLNDFLLQYNVGHALLVAFVLTLPPVLLKASGKVFALFLALFGAIFALAPSSASAAHWRFFGYLLVLVAPVIYVMARR